MTASLGTRPLSICLLPSLLGRPLSSSPEVGLWSGLPRPCLQAPGLPRPSKAGALGIPPPLLSVATGPHL